MQRSRAATGCRGLLSTATIQLAQASGCFSTAQLAYMRASSASTDPRDVVWHRAITQLVNVSASEREFNNRILHMLDYHKSPK